MQGFEKKNIRNIQVFDNQSKKIRSRIKSLYKNSDLTMKQFADKCGISNGTLHNILNTEIPLLESTIFKIAGRLQVDYEWLISEKDTQNKPQEPAPTNAPVRPKMIEERIAEIESHFKELDQKINEIPAIKELLEKLLVSINTNPNLKKHNSENPHKY